MACNPTPSLYSILSESFHGQKAKYFHAINIFFCHSFDTDPTGAGEPIVHIHRTALSRSETHSMTSEKLWEFLARELVTSEIGNKKAKYLAFLSSTEYQNHRKRKPMSHSETLQMTRGHVALGLFEMQ